MLGQTMRSPAVTRSSPRPRIVNSDPSLPVTDSTCRHRRETRLAQPHRRSPRSTVRSGQCRRTSSAGVPMSMIRPWSMIATRSHSRSASSIRCVVRNTVLPRCADAAHQLPDRAPRLRVEAGRQLVEKHHLRIVDQRQRDEQPLLLAARQRHEPGVALVAQAELLEQAIAVDAVCR